MDAFKLTLLAAVLIVLMVFFGGDGASNLRVKTKEEKWEQRLDAASQRDPRLPAGMRGGATPPIGSSRAYYNQKAYNPEIKEQTEEGAAANPSNPYQTPAYNKNSSQIPFPQKRPKWVTTPPEGTPAPSQLPGQSGFYLRSGEKLFFEGTRVFVMDQDGQKVPMPDGTYYSRDSRMTIRIVGGKQYVAN